MSRGHDITDLLAAWRERGPEALEELLPEVMAELRLLARRHLAAERPDHTLRTTALVNELYLRLAASKIHGFEDRHRFYAFASSVLRRILVDHGRARRSEKRGGGWERQPLAVAVERVAAGELDLDMVLAVDQALSTLEGLDSRQARIVELRYFGGLSLPEVARGLGLSQSSVERGWRAAKHWLAHHLSRGASAGPEEPQKKHLRAMPSQTTADPGTE